MEETEIQPNIMNRDTDKTPWEYRAEMLTFTWEVGVGVGKELFVVKAAFELA